MRKLETDRTERAKIFEGFRIDRADSARLRAVASQKGKSCAAVAREAVLRYLDEQQAELEKSA